MVRLLQVLGYHFLGDYLLRSDNKILNDLPLLENLLKRACEIGEFSLFKIVHKKFDPQGLSIIGIIGESHISFHTWPEYHFLSIDIFSCINEEGVQKARTFLESSLPIEWQKVELIKRGFESV